MSTHELDELIVDLMNERHAPETTPEQVERLKATARVLLLVRSKRVHQMERLPWGWESAPGMAL